MSAAHVWSKFVSITPRPLKHFKKVYHLAKYDYGDLPNFMVPFEKAEEEIANNDSQKQSSIHGTQTDTGLRVTWPVATERQQERGKHHVLHVYQTKEGEYKSYMIFPEKDDAMPTDKSATKPNK